MSVHPPAGWQRLKQLRLGLLTTVLTVVLIGSGLAACTNSSQAHARVPHAPVPGVPSGWLAHSAYGLQLSVPKSWAVTYFVCNCPDTLKPGTLSVASSFVCNCPATPQTTNQVTITYVAQPPTAASDPPAHMITPIHGIQVLQLSHQPFNNWVVGGHVVISGSGPNGLAVMRSLARATPQALPAPGFINGTALSGGLQPVPITTAIQYTRVAQPEHRTPVRSVQTLDGEYSATLSPGTYRFSAVSAGASCQAVTVGVLSGRTTTAPTITCPGGD